MHWRYIVEKPEDEQADLHNNKEVKSGLMLWIEYLIAVSVDKSTLTREEWLAEYEADQKT